MAAPKVRMASLALALRIAGPIVLVQTFVAVGADFLVDLEAAPELRVVVGPERRRKAPTLCRDLRRMVAIGLIGGIVLGKSSADRYKKKDCREDERD